MNRKTFLEQLFGCGIVSMFSFSSNAKTNVENDEVREKKGRYLYRRYVAEKYVDGQFGGSIVDKNGRRYVYVAPVGFVKSVDEKTKEIIEIPVKYRRVYCDGYSIYDRETLVQQLVDFFRTRKTGTFLDRI